MMVANDETIRLCVDCGNLFTCTLDAPKEEVCASCFENFDGLTIEELQGEVTTDEAAYVNYMFALENSLLTEVSVATACGTTTADTILKAREEIVVLKAELARHKELIIMLHDILAKKASDKPSISERLIALGLAVVTNERTYNRQRAAFSKSASMEIEGPSPSTEEENRSLSHQEIFKAVFHNAKEIVRLTEAVPVKCTISDI